MRARSVVVTLLGLAVVAASSGAALAAGPRPGPGRPAPQAEVARRCTIGSFEGVLIPGTQVCTRVSGFVRVETRIGRRGPTRH